MITEAISGNPITTAQQSTTSSSSNTVKDSLSLGTWSGGKFMHYGSPLTDDEFIHMFRHAWELGIRTFITSDVYGKGRADELLGIALSPFPRSSYRLVCMLGHDFYHGKRTGNRGYPRFTDPQLRDESGYSCYLDHALTTSLSRCKTTYFDSVLLHNPDEIGYTNDTVWQTLDRYKRTGFAREIGIAPGPANGFVLDLIHAFRTYGDIIDSCMAILNPLEPWPISYIFDECDKLNISIVTRVADYGGALYGNMQDNHTFSNGDHRAYRPEGWVAQANATYSSMSSIANHHQLSPIQFAINWALNQKPVSHITPTVVREHSETMEHVYLRLQEMADTPSVTLSSEELARIAKLGDNTGCMPLKGASTRHCRGLRPDEWPLRPELEKIAEEIKWNPNW